MPKRPTPLSRPQKPAARAGNIAIKRAREPSLDLEALPSPVHDAGRRPPACNAPVTPVLLVSRHGCWRCPDSSPDAAELCSCRCGETKIAHHAFAGLEDQVAANDAPMPDMPEPTNPPEAGDGAVLDAPAQHKATPQHVRPASKVYTPGMHRQALQVVAAVSAPAALDMPPWPTDSSSTQDALQSPQELC